MKRAIFGFLFLATFVAPTRGDAFPSTPQADAGHAAFAHQAVEAVLGRKARGADEVELLADIAGLLGREAVVRLLMKDPAYRVHWTDRLMDHLRVQRSSSGNNTMKQFEGCFGRPKRAAADGTPASDDGALARFVRDNGPETSASFGSAFNFVDVASSAIEEDDLSIVYRAYLFPMNVQRGREFVNDEEKRAIVGRFFENVYLSRSTDCLPCHSSEFSVTNSPAWKRTHPLPFASDRAVFGDDFLKFESVRLGMDRFFTGDARGGPVKPWGMDSTCFQSTQEDAIVGYKAQANVPVLAEAGHFAGMSKNDVSIYDIAANLKEGVDAIDSFGLGLIGPAVNGLPQIQPPRGFAVMVASTIVENVWEDVMGSPLTISHRYARNADQMATHWYLVEDIFLENDWSLEDLLVAILTSDYFNRVPPSAEAWKVPYRMPLVFEPWVEQAPNSPGSALASARYNGQGDIVQRHTVRGLLSSLSFALGWPAPRRYPGAPNGSAFPSEALVRELGQFLSDFEPGTEGVDFQSLLAWDGSAGACINPSGVNEDWIDRVVAEVPIYDAAHPNDPLTVADLVHTMRDWLHQSGGTTTTAERALLATLFGVADLDAEVASVASLESKARSYCGVLLDSPQFMLKGIAPTELPLVPKLRVCNGPPCTYAELCEDAVPKLEAMGHVTSCGARLIGFPPNLQPSGGLHGGVVLNGVFQQACPKGACGFMPRDYQLGECFRHPSQCRLLESPCDPACFGPGCCAGPPGDFTRNLPMVSRLDRATVDVAEEVAILRAGADLRPLKRGETLQAGDVLFFHEGARFGARGPEASIRAAKTGFPNRASLDANAASLKLLEAARKGDAAGVQRALRSGARSNVRDTFGRTPLMLAAMNARTDALSVLLRAGADTSALDHDGATALELARAQKREPAVGLLLPVTPKLRPRSRAPAERAGAFIMRITGGAELAARRTGAHRPSAHTPLRSVDVADRLARGLMRGDGVTTEQIQTERARRNYTSAGQAGSIPSAEERAATQKRHMESPAVGGVR